MNRKQNNLVTERRYREPCKCTIQIYGKTHTLYGKTKSVLNGNLHIGQTGQTLFGTLLRSEIESGRDGYATFTIVTSENIMPFDEVSIVRVGDYVLFCYFANENMLITR